MGEPASPATHALSSFILDPWAWGCFYDPTIDKVVAATNSYDVQFSDQILGIANARDDHTGAPTASPTVTSPFKPDQYIWDTIQPENSENFGNRLASSADTLVVGASSDDNSTTGVSTGGAFIYDITPTSTTFRQILHPQDETDSGAFGKTVAIDGEWIAVADHTNHNTGCSNCGAVFMYKRNGGTGDWDWQQTLTKGGSNDDFGSSISIKGTRMVISANYGGQVYVYEYGGSSWAETHSIDIEDINGEFGNSVSLGTDEFVVSYGGFDNLFTGEGEFLHYKYSGGSWDYGTNYTSGNLVVATNAQFAKYLHVDWDNGWLVACSKDTTGTNVYGFEVWKKTGGGDWEFFQWEEVGGVTTSSVCNVNTLHVREDLLIYADAYYNSQDGAIHTYGLYGSEKFVFIETYVYEEETGDYFGSAVTIQGSELNDYEVYVGTYLSSLSGASAGSVAIMRDVVIHPVVSASPTGAPTASPPTTPHPTVAGTTTSNVIEYVGTYVNAYLQAIALSGSYYVTREQLNHADYTYNFYTHSTGESITFRQSITLPESSSDAQIVGDYYFYKPSSDTTTVKAFKTTDSGLSWSLVGTLSHGATVAKFCAINDAEIFVTTANTDVKRYTRSGETWSLVWSCGRKR